MYDVQSDDFEAIENSCRCLDPPCYNPYANTLSLRLEKMRDNEDWKDE